MKRAIVGMETSGKTRRALQSRGWWVVSVDTQPADDIPNGVSHNGGHFQGDVFRFMEMCTASGFTFDFGLFHPTCTYLTAAAEWAYKDPDFVKYPGVGYHQRLKPGTLFGVERREARERAIDDVVRVSKFPIKVKVIENPVGALSTRWMKPSQIVHPNQFGDNASKATCLWFVDENGNKIPGMKLPIDPKLKHYGRTIIRKGKIVWRYSNQTDEGQERTTPHADRWKKRSETFDGIAKALSCVAT